MGLLKHDKNISDRGKNLIFLGFILFCVIILAVTMLINVKANNESKKILEENVTSQLLAVCSAARERIDTELFMSINSPQDIENNPEYDDALADLRALAVDVGAQYIYALKEVGDDYRFIFDTDTEDPDPISIYEPAHVHLRAFEGISSGDLMNVEDEWGSYNTGAVPLYKDNKIVGVVSVDFEDTVIAHNLEVTQRNTVIMAVSLVIILFLMCLLVRLLLRRVKAMQDTLMRMAHYDKLTDLPNRAFLMDHLDEIFQNKKIAPFTMLFIDLDNFKKVNDTAGHDAGDELLQNIGKYLASKQSDVKVFRPTAGALTVAARVGGDEFILLLPKMDDQAEVSAFAQELIDGFKTQVHDENIEKYDVGLSIGIAMFPKDTKNYHVLIKYADIAMYHSKRGGKNQYRIYTDDMTPKDEK